MYSLLKFWKAAETEAGREAGVNFCLSNTVLVSRAVIPAAGFYKNKIVCARV